MKIKLTRTDINALTTVRAYPRRDVATGHTDAKGRKIGGRAYRCDSVNPEGVIIYSGSVDNTRNGDTHGPGTEPQFFTTAEMRDAYIEKRFDSILAKYPAI